GRARAVVDADLCADGGGADAAAGGTVSGVEPMMPPLTLHSLTIGLLLIFLALLPIYVASSGNVFMLTLFTRIVILAMAATSLNLILGYGGMVSFGHAAYLGVGAYA